MKRTLKVGHSFGGKISTGPYENMNPVYYAEQVFDVDGTDEQIKSIIDTIHGELREMIQARFRRDVTIAESELAAKLYGQFRWYERNGEKFISVTSILNVDAEFYVSDEELRQYAAQGTIIDAKVKRFIKNGEWIDAMKLEGIAPELLIVKNGSLKLSFDVGDFPAFLGKYELKNMKVGEPCFNLEHHYAGTPDIICDYEGLPTIADIKRNVSSENKVKYLKQTAAYAKCFDGIKQLMLIPLNDKTEQGWSKPIITQEVDKYFELFLDDRKKFKEKFNA